MTSFNLCEQLLHSSEPQQREPLLEAAAASTECMDYFLESAREQIAADPVDARTRAELAAALAERRQDHRSAAQAWRVSAQALRVQGNHAGAVLALETAAAKAIQADDPVLTACVQIGRVDSLGWLGRYDEALALARRLEAELRLLGELTEAAKVLLNMGALHYRRDQYLPALSCYERALEALVSSGDAVAIARVQGNMASVLMELHRVDEAILLFEQARQAFIAQNMVTAAAMIDANVGFLHYLSGKYAAAVAALSRAREEFTQRGQMLETAKCDADLADAYRELNLHPEALAAYGRAIAEMEGHAIDYERARAELGRASVWMMMAQTEEALAGLERAESLFRGHRNTTQLAHVRLLRAHLLRGQGDITSAHNEAQHAAKALQRRRLYGWAAEARFLLADMALETGQDLVHAMHAVRRAAQKYARGWLECRAQHALGRHYLRRGDLPRGVGYLRAGVQALEQTRTSIVPEGMHVSFLKDKLHLYEEVVGVLLARGGRRDIAEALEYVERAKSRLLLERIQASLEGRLAANDLTTPMRDRLAFLRAELSRSYHRMNALDANEARRTGVAGEDEAVALATLEEEYRTALQEAEARQTERIHGISALSNVIPTHSLSTRLGEEEILLEYYIVAGTICAWVVTREGIFFRPDVAQVEAVRYLSRRLRHQLQRMGAGSELTQRHADRFLAGIQEVLQEFHDLLLLPLADLLVGEKLVVIPHGELHGLPFHAFFDGRTYTLARWEFVYAPSAAVWYAGAGRRRYMEKVSAADASPMEALLMGVPGPGIERVEEEVKQLAMLLPSSRLLCGNEATVDAFHLYAGRCRLLHMATHGLYRTDNPLFSGLQLSDGWLLARDLYEVTLDCDLATLSACQTGTTSVEAGDELFGLIRGFLSAGARSVAASLWLADDRATTYLMADFYRRMKEGSTKAAALRGAQQHTQERYPHPYYWAAFALMGER